MNKQRRRNSSSSTNSSRCEMTRQSAHISCSLVLQRIWSLCPEEEDVAVMVQLRLVHSIFVDELGNPVGTHHCNDDAKEEVNAPGALYDNDHLQQQ